MATPDEIAAAAAVGGTAQGAAPTGTQPDFKEMYEKAVKESAEEHARFTGLQGKYQQEQERWTKTEQAKAAAEAKVNTLIGEKEALSLQHSTAVANAATLAQAKQVAEAQVARINLIASKFQPLLPFEAKGLLPPAATAEELEIKLVDFAAQLKGLSAEAVQSFSNGSVPPPPASATANTSAALFKQANVAMKAGNMDDYNRLYSSAIALSQQGK